MYRYAERSDQELCRQADSRGLADRRPKGFPEDILAAARRKLAILDAANVLDDLRSPPGNCLEPLSGDRAGQHSIRVNKQWRLCFAWHDDDAYDVEIVDYH